MLNLTKCHYAEPAEIVIRPPNQTEVVSGRTVVFTCVSRGMPTPSFNWSRDGNILSDDSRISIYEEVLVENGLTFIQSMLEVCSVSEEDAGEYSCTAGNEVGSETAVFEVSVLGKDCKIACL